MSFIKRIYKLLPSQGLKERAKEIYFNTQHGETFSRNAGNYLTKFKNGIRMLTKLPMYYIVKDIHRYEQYYTIASDDVVIDAGANHGYLSIYYGKKVGLSGKVYAFEPDEINIAEMKENIALNAVDNIQIQSELIWNENTQIAFYEAGTVSSSIHYKPENAKEILKDAITIDAFCEQQNLERLDFIKMDIEGAEIEAMDGLVTILEKFKPNFAIASYHWIDGKQTYAAVEAFFEKHNYPYKTVFYKDGEVITFAGNSVA